MYRDYLDREVLDGFDRYKYSCRDTSPLSNYVMHPFWNKAVLLCPTWVAPNLLTLVGFLCCVLHYLLPTFYDYDFTASTSGSDHPIPSWMWALVSLLLFASHTLDGIDGKQARRTGTSSPLGELFDHGCDAWAAVFITSTFYSTFGRNDDNLSIPVMRMFCVLWNVFLCFHISHWEKYNTGIMYLPWGYDISMVGGTVLYALTSVVGYQAWKYTLPGGLSPGPLFEFLLYLGSAGMAVPVALRNIYRSYRDGTGHMRSFGEAVRPLVSFFLAMLLCLLWANLSANNILFEDTRMFFYVSGTLCANMSCRLIVAQMSNTRCELFNVLLALLAAAVASSLLIPGFPREAELSILYLLAIVFTVMHLHYGICVVIQMCRHLKIEAFRIKYHGEVRLLSSHPDVDDDDNSFNDDEVIDVADANDLEIVVTSNSKTGNAVKPATVKSHVLQV